MAALSGLIVGLNTPLFGGFSIGNMLDPRDGLYYTARHADKPLPASLELDALREPVSIIQDLRGVPHIYAENDDDLLVVFGYVVARDRLFEMDFIPRATAGRLSEILGPSALDTDRFFRSIGLAWSAKKNMEDIGAAHSEQVRISSLFQKVAIEYIGSLSERDYPFEMRLLGYGPEPLDYIDSQMLLQYMIYDLSYRGQGSARNELRAILGSQEYELLYPRYSKTYVPIIPPSEASWSSVGEASIQSETSYSGIKFPTGPEASIAEGFRTGIGSNNWAVSGSRSETGFPILGGDMHLNLSLPALWYEAHLVSPNMNLYGVTIPGAPNIVEGITETTAWAFTNTGSDQIDYYVLETSDDRTHYLFEGSMVPFEVVSDTIFVAHGEPVVEEYLYSRYGPVFLRGDQTTTMRWVGHDRSRSAEALWNMGHARSYAEFEKALELWDSPMQNILFASRDDTVAIRSTGHLPIRAGADGSGVLDGSSGKNFWSGRVPFDELPYVINPEQGYLASANQQPADSTYPYYLGSDWRDGYRSLRINELLAGKDKHSVQDIMSYQADVHVVQADHFIPFLTDLEGLSENAIQIRNLLIDWDRETRIDQVEPLLFDFFLTDFVTHVWDELVFVGRPDPSDMTVYFLLETDPESHWFDIEATAERENAWRLLRDALERTASRYYTELVENEDNLRWGLHNHIVFKHLTRSQALKPLWRGPFEYPGYRATLSPSGSRMNTFSASWRVVVDFSSVPPNAYGIYPGGQSGNPFSTRYDENVDTYLAFKYHSLIMASSPSSFPETDIASTTMVRPSGATSADSSDPVR